ncbi:hypothetical protein GGS20DRAFT_564880 [Poronia punctata]|nr:hypothetical protein GGS20DRAFT_564880 [Poronia punctata]
MAVEGCGNVVVGKTSFFSSALRDLVYNPATKTAKATPRTHDTQTTIAALSGGRYMEVLPPDVEPIRALLTGYSGIRPEDVDRHVYGIRDKLWDVYPYSCVGLFRFASLDFVADAYYQVALFRLLQAEASSTTDQTRLLDVGCCVGQLVRKLAFDGVDSARLYGTDIEPRLLDIGYDLFRDRGKFKGSFITGDFLRHDELDDLDALHGKMTFIHATSFFHLFTWAEQLRVATRMVQLLDPDRPDVMIFGRHVGTMQPRPGGGNAKAGSDKVYLHNAETWQMLWDQVGELTGTKWSVTMEPIEKIQIDTGGVDSSLRKMLFCVMRA